MLNLNLFVMYLVSNFNSFFNSCFITTMDVVPYILSFIYLPIVVKSQILFIYEDVERVVEDILRPQILEFKLAVLTSSDLSNIGKMVDKDIQYIINYSDTEDLAAEEEKEFSYNTKYENVYFLNKESRRYSNENMDIIDSIGCKRSERNWKSHRNNQYKIVNK